jgi:hypothetical protein
MFSSSTNWPQQDGLRIGHLNINSAQNKLCDISTILCNSNNPFHVFGFTESRLSTVVSDNDVNLPGFKIIRKDPTSPKSTGIIIYVSELLHVKRLYDLERYEIEAVWLEIKLKRCKPIKVGFVYRNPAERVDWNDKFSSMMDAASLDATENLLLGDFNTDLLKPHPSWIDKLSSYGLTQIVDKPTRITASSKTLIDHIYVTNKQSIKEICVPIYGCSDHLPTCLTWRKKGVKIPKSGHKEITYRSFANFDENKFLADLMVSPLSNVYNFTNPEEALEFWLHTFKSMYNQHAPLRTRRVKHTPKPKWITSEIENAAFLRDDLLEKGKFEEFRAQRNKVNSLKRAAKQKYFQNLVSSKQNSKSIWKAINELVNKQSPSQSCLSIEVSPEDLNKHFTTMADKIIIQKKTELNTLDKLAKFCSSKNINSNLNIPFMSVIEVYQFLCHLKQTGSRGHDDIDSKILKTSAPIISETLTYIYNLCIEKCTFPTQFKTAKVIPLFKSGNCSDPSNYRPISILSTLSKPLEKHINKHIYHHLNSYDLLSKSQSGFRKNHSCHTTLSKMVDAWLHNINENKFCGVLFVDFAKAFDVIDHKLLCRKLILYGITGDRLKLISSYLNNRLQYICVNNSRSNVLPVRYGVPQGSILGPLLFSIYVNDLPLHLQEECELFCDDTTIHTSHTNLSTISQSLQKSINTLGEWCNLNHMSLNPHKTKLMLLTTRQKRQILTTQLPPIYIEGVKVEEVDKHRVLGVIIDNNLSWKTHINNLCKNLSKRVYQLCKIKHFLNLHARKLFLHAYILSSINYCSTLFDTASANTLKPLISIYKRALKAVLLKSSSVTNSDYIKLDILPLKNMLNINKCIFMHRILCKSVPDTLYSNFHRHLRCSTKLQIPIPRIDLFKSSLCYSGSLLWNMLPTNLRLHQNTEVFRKYLTLHFKTELS